MTRARATAKRGEPARWVVAAWTTGGSVPDAVVRLAAAPASVRARFSFGCGSSDGSASCDLGAMDSRSARRQLQAQVTVPVSASKVTSVTLTVSGHAAHLPKAPKASAEVTITKPAAPAATTTPLPSGTAPGVPSATTTPLPVGSLPSLTTPGPRLSPGGNAAGLFPKLAPSPNAGAKASARQLADTTALPEGTSVAGAQIAGLTALALALILAVTRFSIRRPAPLPASPPDETAPLQPVESAETEQPGESDPGQDGSAS